MTRTVAIPDVIFVSSNTRCICEKTLGLQTVKIQYFSVAPCSRWQPSAGCETEGCGCDVTGMLSAGILTHPFKICSIGPIYHFLYFRLWVNFSIFYFWNWSKKKKKNSNLKLDKWQSRKLWRKYGNIISFMRGNQQFIILRKYFG